jgi:hypothetical protein
VASRSEAAGYGSMALRIRGELVTVVSGRSDRGRAALSVTAVVLALGVAQGAADGGWIQAAVNGACVLLGAGVVYLGLRSFQRGERDGRAPREH